MSLASPRLWLFLALLCSGALAHEATPLPKLLQPGKPLRDQEWHDGEALVYRVVVPVGMRRLIFKTGGGRGDCDLFARHGAHPSADENAGASTGAATTELITIDAPTAGNWYLLVESLGSVEGVRLDVIVERDRNAERIPHFLPGPGVYLDSARVSLRGAPLGTRIRTTIDGTDPVATSLPATKPVELRSTRTLKARIFKRDGTPLGPIAEGRYTIEKKQPVALQRGVALPHRAGNAGSFTFLRLAVPAGARALRLHTSGGTGDTELFLRHSELPAPDRFDARANGPRNLASLEVKDPAAGDWFILLRGRSAFSGVSVLAHAVSTLPDLIAWPATLEPYLTTETFDDDDCAVLEGFLTAAGTRRLLRFSTESRNIGGGDLIIGRPQDHPAWFEYQSCHDHFHFLSFAAYRLLDLSGAVVASGRKVSFCLLDSFRWDPFAEAESRFDCRNQGIQGGWSDIYDSGLDGQWVDVTDVPPGEYQLEITMDPDNLLFEADEANNTVRIPVAIPAP